MDRASYETAEIDAVYSRCSDRDLSALSRKRRRLAKLFDGTRTVAQVLKAARVSQSNGRTLVKELIHAGVLCEASSTRSSSASTGFTPQEEAFFASDVQPIDECNEPFDTTGRRMGMVLHGWLTRLGYSLHVTQLRTLPKRSTKA